MGIQNAEFTVHLYGHGYDNVWPDASIRVDDVEHVYRLVRGKQSFTFESQIDITQGALQETTFAHTLSVVWSNFRPSLIKNNKKMYLEIQGIDVEGSPVHDFTNFQVEKLIEIHCKNDQTTGTHMSNNGTWLINFTTPYPFIDYIGA